MLSDVTGTIVSVLRVGENWHASDGPIQIVCKCREDATDLHDVMIRVRRERRHTDRKRYKSVRLSCFVGILCCEITNEGFTYVVTIALNLRSKVSSGSAILAVPSTMILFTPFSFITFATLSYALAIGASFG